jgi:SET domain-containing protein
MFTSHLEEYFKNEILPKVSLELLYKIYSEKEEDINFYLKLIITINRRLPLCEGIPLCGENKIEIRKSPAHASLAKSEIGVFTKEKIFKGEIITLYPVHYISYKNKTQFFSREIEKRSLSYDESKIRGCCFDEDISVYGDVRIIDDPHFLGHCINDGARSHSERDVKIYLTCSKAKANSTYVLIPEDKPFILAIVAIKDIDKDKEVFAHYGVDYWRHFYS